MLRKRDNSNPKNIPSRKNIQTHTHTHTHTHLAQKSKQSTTLQVSNVNEYVCVIAVKPRKPSKKSQMKHNNNVCCLKFCKRVQSGTNDSFMLYYKL